MFVVAIGALALGAIVRTPPMIRSRHHEEPTATDFTFRVDAPPFVTMRALDGQPPDVTERCRLLEAELASLDGAANKMRRRRIRQRIEKLKSGDDVFREARAALNAVALPPTPPSSTAAARSAAAPPHAAPTSPRPILPPRATQGRRRRSRSRSPPRGSQPNIAWRAVSMDELRAHPAFIALPLPDTVAPAAPADLRLYRQDSRQWWECHAGRISTSACASCLGVYEDRAASLLGVPPSLRGHGKALDAHARLQSPVLGPAEYALLYLGDDDEAHAHARGEAVQAVEAAAEAAMRRLEAAWKPHRNRAEASPFLYAYQPKVGDGARRARGGGGGDERRVYHSVGQIRMAWGSVQEATSILAALNYLGARNATVEEAGLQPLEALDGGSRLVSGAGALAERLCEGLPDGLPPIGASPDAIVRWSDGSVEPFEVKNHAPFATNRNRRTDPEAPPFVVRDPGPYDEVAVWHVPRTHARARLERS